MSSTLPPPSLPPSTFEPPNLLDDASTSGPRPIVRLRTTGLMVPPPPDGDDIPAWHLGAGVKPLRPLPRDLAVHMRRKSLTPFRVRAAETPAPPAPQRVRAKEMSGVQTVRVSVRRPARTRAWRRRVVALLLGAMFVGAAAGVLSERVVHHFAPSR